MERSIKAYVEQGQDGWQVYADKPCPCFGYGETEREARDDFMESLFMQLAKKDVKVHFVRVLSTLETAIFSKIC